MDRLDLKEQIVTCTNCELSTEATPTPFSGPADAAVVVLGEGPGKLEEEEGRPFVGPAGQLLRQLLSSVGIDPSTLGYCNTVSCFPHGTPNSIHIAACEKNRLDQLEYFNPEFVLVLGNVALHTYYPDLAISLARGHPFCLDGRIHFPAYHPSAALRNPTYKVGLQEDLVVFKDLIRAKDWYKFIPDTCTGCNNQVLTWIGEDGLGWCAEHAPKAYSDRMNFLTKEIGNIRSGSQQELRTTLLPAQATKLSKIENPKRVLPSDPIERLALFDAEFGSAKWRQSDDGNVANLCSKCERILTKHNVCGDC